MTGRRGKGGRAEKRKKYGILVPGSLSRVFTSYIDNAVNAKVARGEGRKMRLFETLIEMVLAQTQHKTETSQGAPSV